MAIPAIHAGGLSAAGASVHVTAKIRAIGGLKHDTAQGSATSSNSGEMTPAVTIAMMMAIVATTRSETIVAISDSGPVWADMMTVPPHTITVVGLLMLGVDEDSCELVAGCSCFIEVGAREIVVIPPMELYEQTCVTLTSSLVEIPSVVSFSVGALQDAITRSQCANNGYSLLPFVRTQAALHHSNGTMCFTANTVPVFQPSPHQIPGTIALLLLVAWGTFCIVSKSP